jgi:hypothetical protein
MQVHLQHDLLTDLLALGASDGVDRMPDAADGTGMSAQAWRKVSRLIRLFEESQFSKPVGTPGAPT